MMGAVPQSFGFIAAVRCCHVKQQVGLQSRAVLRRSWIPPAQDGSRSQGAGDLVEHGADIQRIARLECCSRAIFQTAARQAPDQAQTIPCACADGFCRDAQQRVATGVMNGGSEPCRIRTCDTRIKSPLLYQAELTARMNQNAASA